MMDFGKFHPHSAILLFCVCLKEWTAVYGTSVGIRAQANQLKAKLFPNLTKEMWAMVAWNLEIKFNFDYAKIHLCTLSKWLIKGGLCSQSPNYLVYTNLILIFRLSSLWHLINSCFLIIYLKWIYVKNHCWISCPAFYLRFIGYRPYN